MLPLHLPSLLSTPHLSFHPLLMRAEHSVLGDGSATVSVWGQKLFSPVKTCDIRGTLRFQQASTQLLHTATTTYGNRTGYSAGNAQQSMEEVKCNQDCTIITESQSGLGSKDLKDHPVLTPCHVDVLYPCPFISFRHFRE